MNRTLLSLNLGSNLIGDNGASKLAEVSKTLSLRLLLASLEYLCLLEGCTINNYVTCNLLCFMNFSGYEKLEIINC